MSRRKVTRILDHINCSPGDCFNNCHVVSCEYYQGYKNPDNPETTEIEIDINDEKELTS